jgi:hypothetical protein
VRPAPPRPVIERPKGTARHYEEFPLETAVRRFDVRLKRGDRDVVVLWSRDPSFEDLMRGILRTSTRRCRCETPTRRRTPETVRRLAAKPNLILAFQPPERLAGAATCATSPPSWRTSATWRYDLEAVASRIATNPPPDGDPACASSSPRRAGSVYSIRRPDALARDIRGQQRGSW